MFDFNAHNLFKKRLSSHLKELSRYTQYMFNAHIAFAMFFFIAAFAYYYQSWLEHLPENFPSGIVIGVVFGLVLTYSPVSTLLQDPDLFFLIAAEKKMGPYFRNALIYSYVVQLYLVFLSFAMLGPLYFASYPDREPKLYLLLLVVILIFKAWNVYANWSILKIRDPVFRRIDIFVRGILNIGVCYFLIVGNMMWATVCTILFIAIFIYDVYASGKKPGIVWDLLVEKDAHRMHAFYRIANMFTDVGHLKNRVKRRKWLTGLINQVPFAQEYTYRYLFRITFIRSGDYLWMYIRLIIIGGLFIYFIPADWMKLLFALLFLYLSCFQLMAIYKHHRASIWLDLYPIRDELRKEAVIRGLYQLMGLQTVLFTILFAVGGDFLGAGIMLVGGMIWNILFINLYVKRKMTS